MRIGITYNVKSPALPSATLSDDDQEEFDTPETIDCIAGVLRDLGHQVVLLGEGRDMLARLLADPPDLVFNLAEGRGVSRSREARVPAALEMLDIPYTGSDPLALAATLDKCCAKRLVASAGVACPRSVVVEQETGASEAVASLPLELPVVVKPAWEGSSKGIHDACLVDDADRLVGLLTQLRQSQRQPLLIEEFIRGDEVTVAVVGNAPPRILGAMRILPLADPEHFIYSLEAKRNYQTRVRYESPARLPADVLARLEDAALRAYRVLGCQDIARIDFRVRDGIPYFLEANPLPGLSPETGDLVLLARGYGWSHSRLIEAIVQHALQRQVGVVKQKRAC